MTAVDAVFTSSALSLLTSINSANCFEVSKDSNVVYIDTGEPGLNMVGEVRAGVWTGLELERMYEGIEAVYLVLVKGLRFVLCLTETCC